MKSFRILFFFITVVKFSYSQEIVNGSFEIVNSKVIPRNWQISNTDNKYIIKIDSVQKQSGKYAISIDGSAFANASLINDGIVYNSFGAISAKKITTIEINGWAKMKNPVDSGAALFIQDLSGEKIIRAFVKNSHDQQWNKIQLKYSGDSTIPWYGFNYGVEVCSKSLVWFDNISIKIDGQLIKDPAGLNFEPATENIQWLNKNLRPLKSVEAGTSDGDMVPIGQLCSAAKIVGIGEPTHGTRESFKFKLRLLEYLVNRKGFNTIALEEVIPTCDIMNDLINNANLSLKDSLLALPFYNCWKTSEVNELFEWIRTYNTTHKNKVTLIGIDMEDRKIKMSRRSMEDYGNANNQRVLSQTKLLNIKFDSLIAISARNENTAKAVTELSTQIDAMKATLKSEKLNINNEEQYFNLQTYLRVCRQWLDTRFAQGDRDKDMADNIAFYSDQHPAAKILIWAHNFHIANITLPGQKTMGGYLKENYAGKYLPIGFTTSQGAYTASEDQTQKIWKKYPFETAYKGTYEYILSRAKKDLYFLPLNSKESKMKEALWLNMPMKHLDCGYIHLQDQDDYKFYGNLKSVFDGIIFCKSTSASNSYLFTK